MCSYFQIQSQIFGNAQKGLKKIYFLAFLTTFFDMFGLIGSVKTFSKVLEVGMNVGPYGSVSAGREFWPSHVTFFLVRASLWPNQKS